MQPEHSAIANLRWQPFYRGQIRSIHTLPQLGPKLVHEVTDPKSYPETVSRLPSYSTICGILYPEGIFAGVNGAIHKAVGESEVRDTHLLAESSQEQRQFAILITVLETIDLGRTVTLVTADRDAAIKYEQFIRQTLESLDFAYAVSLLLIHDTASLNYLESESANIVVASLDDYCRLLLPETSERTFTTKWIRSVGRILFPDLDQWSGEQAANGALAVRCLRILSSKARGDCRFSAILRPSRDAKSQLARFLGKQHDDEEIVHADGAPLNGGNLVVYSSNLKTDPDSPGRLVRESSQDTFSDLIRYLVGEHTAELSGLALHYIVDHSKSMEWQNRLKTVKKTLIEDFSRRSNPDSGSELHLGDKDEISIIQFSDDASVALPRAPLADNRSKFSDAVNAIKVQGNTNFIPALRKLLDQVESSDSRRHVALILTDGGFYDYRTDSLGVLNRLSAIRASGKQVDIIYLALDFDPPVTTLEFIRRIGGRIVKTGFAVLDEELRQVAPKQEGNKVVVLDDPESTLTTQFVRDGLSGHRQLVVQPSIDAIDFSEEDIYAIVAMGWHGGYEKLEAKVARIGRAPIPVFLLAEPDSRALIAQEGPEFERFAVNLSDFACHDRNPMVVQRWLRTMLAHGPLTASEILYLAVGVKREGLIDSNSTPPDPKEVQPFIHGLSVKFLNGRFDACQRALPPPPDPNTTTRFQNYLSNGRHTIRFDHSVAPIRYYNGRRIRLGGEPVRISDDNVKETGEIPWTNDDREQRIVPIVECMGLEQTQVKSPEIATAKDNPLGQFQHQPVNFVYRIPARRIYRKDPLDSEPEVEYADDIPEQAFETVAWSWKLPKDCPEDYIHDLVGMLIQGLHTQFRNYSARLLPAVSYSRRTIHLIDLTPGGNGASRLLAENSDLVDGMLAAGAWCGLLCLCESNFTSVTKPDTGKQGGCARCSGIASAAIANFAEDTIPETLGQKKLDTIEWLATHLEILPDAVIGWSAMKRPGGSGLSDSERYTPQQTRTPPIPIANRILKIYRDRFGFDLDDVKVGTFAGWLSTEEAGSGTVGGYQPKENAFRFAKGLPEWLALDVYAHEFFHNLQWGKKGVFAMDPLATESIPLEHKLFIEGSAVWAESHIVEGLAIRTSITINSLRHGDEYGEGFFVIKYIEEEFGGIPAVFDFLATADIARISDGRFQNLENFWTQMGVGNPGTV